MTALPFWAPLALLGFAPWMILMQLAISLTYQFWIHTERVRKLPAPVEFFFNTPSHHRVHHGANEVYLDRNYGGILIVWDRIFGTFQGETERPVYGLTQNIRTFRPHRVAFHEFVAIGRDVRAREALARPLRLRLPRSRLVAGRPRRRHPRLSPPTRRGFRSGGPGVSSGRMSLGLLLIVIGIVLAILVNYVLGIICILIGLALIIVPRLSGGGARRV